MTWLRAPGGDGGAEGVLVHARAVVGRVRLGGEDFVVEAAYFEGFADVRLRRCGDRRLFGLRASGGGVDVGLRVLVDVITGAVLHAGVRPVRVMVVGDVLEAAAELGPGLETESGGGAS